MIASEASSCPGHPLSQDASYVDVDDPLPEMRRGPGDAWAWRHQTGLPTLRRARPALLGTVGRAWSCGFATTTKGAYSYRAPSLCGPSTTGQSSTGGEMPSDASV